jgi:hypothetical protein
MQNEENDPDDKNYVNQTAGNVKCKKAKQPTNNQNSCDKSQHDFVSLFPRANPSPLYIRAQRPSPVSVEFLADLTCASQIEMSVHLGTVRVWRLPATRRGGFKVQQARPLQTAPRFDTKGI